MVMFRKLKARLAVLELKDAGLEARCSRFEKRNEELEERLKKLEETPPAEDLTKEQVEAMEKQLYEWQNGEDKA